MGDRAPSGAWVYGSRHDGRVSTVRDDQGTLRCYEHQETTLEHTCEHVQDVITRNLDGEGAHEWPEYVYLPLYQDLYSEVLLIGDTYGLPHGFRTVQWCGWSDDRRPVVGVLAPSEGRQAIRRLLIAHAQMRVDLDLPLCDGDYHKEPTKFELQKIDYSARVHDAAHRIQKGLCESCIGLKDQLIPKV